MKCCLCLLDREHHGTDVHDAVTVIDGAAVCVEHLGVMVTAHRTGADQ